MPIGRDDETPLDRARPHLPTTKPLHRAAMAASWIREAARVLRSLGQVERADLLEREATAGEEDPLVQETR